MRTRREGRAAAVRLLPTTYFSGLDDALDTALALPVAGLHVDLARTPGQIDDLLAKAPASTSATAR